MTKKRSNFNGNPRMAKKIIYTLIIGRLPASGLCVAEKNVWIMSAVAGVFIMLVCEILNLDVLTNHKLGLSQ